MSIDQFARARNIWSVLVSRSKLVEPKITYGEVAKEVGIHHRAVQFALGLIVAYCRDHGVPPLTALVVNKDTRVPGSAFLDWYSGDLQAAFDSIADFDWSGYGNPFEVLSKEQSYESIVEEILSDPSGSRKTLLRVEGRGMQQQIFRSALLRAYKGRCCVCGLDRAVALEAAHIVPWVIASEEQKSSANNGLLLCATHHKLFDGDVLKIDRSYEIGYSEKDGNLSEQSFSHSTFKQDGDSISLPKLVDLYPDPYLLSSRARD